MYTKVQKYLYLVLFSVFLLYFVTSVGKAEPMDPISSPINTDDKVVVVDSNKVEKDLFASSPLYSLNKEVTENVFITGSDVKINQRARENLFVLANNLEINQKIGENLFVVGGKIEINEKVGSDAYIVGDIVMINEEIEDDLYISASQVYINKSVEIGGNVNIIASKVEVYENVKVMGNININGISDLSRFSTKEMPTSINLVKPLTDVDLSSISIGLLAIIGEALLGVVLFKYFGKQMLNIQQLLILDKSHIIGNAKNGLLGYILLTLGIVVGFVSIVGWPFVAFGIAGYTLVSYIIKASIAYKLGDMFVNKFIHKESSFLKLLVGYVLVVGIVGILSIIPFAGPVLLALVVMVANVVTFGAIIGQIKLTYKLNNETKS